MLKEVFLLWCIIWGMFGALILMFTGDTSMLNTLVLAIALVCVVYGINSIVNHNKEE